MQPANFEQLIERLRTWGEGDENVLAIVVVGSWARGAAHPQSDVDVVAIVCEPRQFFEKPRWLSAFGRVQSTVDEDYGLLRAIRAHFDDGMEIEFGFTSEEWLSEKEAAVTGQILADGHRIVCDKSGILASFIRLHLRADR